jgi:hypothetical protein
MEINVWVISWFKNGQIIFQVPQICGLLVTGKDVGVVMREKQAMRRSS